MKGSGIRDDDLPLARYLIYVAWFLPLRLTIIQLQYPIAYCSAFYRTPNEAIQYLSPTMALIPQFHRGGLSAVSRLLDNYENVFSNLGGIQTYAPSFDVRETEKAYYLDGDLPGVQQKDLEIEFEDEHCLNIKAHSERDSTSEKGSWRASERFVGDFRRAFNFPTAVDQDHTHAHLKNGVLSLEVPKSTESLSRKKVDILD